MSSAAHHQQPAVAHTHIHSPVRLWWLWPGGYVLLSLLLLLFGAGVEGRLVCQYHHPWHPTVPLAFPLRVNTTGEALFADRSQTAAFGRRATMWDSMYIIFYWIVDTEENIFLVVNLNEMSLASFADPEWVFGVEVSFSDPNAMVQSPFVAFDPPPCGDSTGQPCPSWSPTTDHQTFLTDVRVRHTSSEPAGFLLGNWTGPKQRFSHGDSTSVCVTFRQPSGAPVLNADGSAFYYLQDPSSEESLTSFDITATAGFLWDTQTCCSDVSLNAWISWEDGHPEPVWNGYSQVSISWNVTAFDWRMGTVTLQLFRGQELAQVLGEDLPLNGTYIWDLSDPPSELPLGDGYFVKAVENGLFAFGITDTFSVQNVNISVSVSPTEDIFLGLTAVQVSWTTDPQNSVFQDYVVEIVDGAGQVVLTMNSSLPNEGSLSPFVLPLQDPRLLPSNDYRVRIGPALIPYFASFSEPLDVRNVTILVLSPTDPTVVTAGFSNVTIVWTTDPPTAPISLQLSLLRQGLLDQVLQVDLARQGNYTFLAPLNTEATSNVLFRLSATDAPAIFADSLQFVLDAVNLTVTVPNPCYEGYPCPIYVEAASSLGLAIPFSAVQLQLHFPVGTLLQELVGEGQLSASPFQVTVPYQSYTTGVSGYVAVAQTLPRSDIVGMSPAWTLESAVLDILSPQPGQVVHDGFMGPLIEWATHALSPVGTVTGTFLMEDNWGSITLLQTLFSDLPANGSSSWNLTALQLDPLLGSYSVSISDGITTASVPVTVQNLELSLTLFGGTSRVFPNFETSILLTFNGPLPAEVTSIQLVLCDQQVSCDIVLEAALPAASTIAWAWPVPADAIRGADFFIRALFVPRVQELGASSLFSIQDTISNVSIPRYLFSGFSSSLHWQFHCNPAVTEVQFLAQNLTVQQGSPPTTITLGSWPMAEFQCGNVEDPPRNLETPLLIPWTGSSSLYNSSSEYIILLRNSSHAFTLAKSPPFFIVDPVVSLMEGSLPDPALFLNFPYNVSWTCSFPNTSRVSGSLVLSEEGLDIPLFANKSSSCHPLSAQRPLQSTTFVAPNSLRVASGWQLHLWDNDHPWIQVLSDPFPAVKSLQHVSFPQEAIVNRTYNITWSCELNSAISRVQVSLLEQANLSLVAVLYPSVNISCPPQGRNFSVPWFLDGTVFEVGSYVLRIQDLDNPLEREDSSPVLLRDASIPITLLNGSQVYPDFPSSLQWSPSTLLPSEITAVDVELCHCEDDDDLAENCPVVGLLVAQQPVSVSSWTWVVPGGLARGAGYYVRTLFSPRQQELGRTAHFSVVDSVANVSIQAPVVPGFPATVSWVFFCNPLVSELQVFARNTTFSATQPSLLLLSMESISCVDPETQNRTFSFVWNIPLEIIDTSATHPFMVVVLDPSQPLLVNSSSTHFLFTAAQIFIESPPSPGGGLVVNFPANVTWTCSFPLQTSISGTLLLKSSNGSVLQSVDMFSNSNSTCSPDPGDRPLQQAEFEVPGTLAPSDEWQFLLWNPQHPHISTESQPFRVAKSLLHVVFPVEAVVNRTYNISWTCQLNPRISSVRVELLRVSDMQVVSVLNYAQAVTCPPMGKNFTQTWYSDGATFPLGTYLFRIQDLDNPLEKAESDVFSLREASVSVHLLNGTTLFRSFVSLFSWSPDTLMPSDISSLDVWLCASGEYGGCIATLGTDLAVEVRAWPWLVPGNLSSLGFMTPITSATTLYLQVVFRPLQQVLGQSPVFQISESLRNVSLELPVAFRGFSSNVTWLFGCNPLMSTVEVFFDNPSWSNPVSLGVVPTVFSACSLPGEWIPMSLSWNVSSNAPSQGRFLVQDTQVVGVESRSSPFSIIDAEIFLSASPQPQTALFPHYSSSIQWTCSYPGTTQVSAQLLRQVEVPWGGFHFLESGGLLMSRVWERFLVGLSLPMNASAPENMQCVRLGGICSSFIRPHSCIWFLRVVGCVLLVSVQVGVDTRVDIFADVPCSCDPHPENRAEMFASFTVPGTVSPSAGWQFRVWDVDHPWLQVVSNTTFQVVKTLQSVNFPLSVVVNRTYHIPWTCVLNPDVSQVAVQLWSDSPTAQLFSTVHSSIPVTCSAGGTTVSQPWYIDGAVIPLGRYFLRVMDLDNPLEYEDSSPFDVIESRIWPSVDALTASWATNPVVFATFPTTVSFSCNNPDTTRVDIFLEQPLHAASSRLLGRVDTAVCQLGTPRQEQVWTWSPSAQLPRGTISFLRLQDVSDQQTLARTSAFQIEEAFFQLLEPLSGDLWMKFEQHPITFACNHPAITLVNISFLFARENTGNPHSFSIRQNYPTHCDPSVTNSFMWAPPNDVSIGELLYAVIMEDSTVGLAQGSSGLVDIDDPVIEVLNPLRGVTFPAGQLLSIRWTCNREAMTSVQITIVSLLADGGTLLLFEEMVSSVCQRRDLSNIGRFPREEGSPVNTTTVTSLFEHRANFPPPFENEMIWDPSVAPERTSTLRVTLTDRTHPNNRVSSASSGTFRMLKAGEAPLPGDLDPTGEPYAEEDTAPPPGVQDSSSGSDTAARLWWLILLAASVPVVAAGVWVYCSCCCRCCCRRRRQLQRQATMKEQLEMEDRDYQTNARYQDSKVPASFLMKVIPCRVENKTSKRLDHAISALLRDSSAVVELEVPPQPNPPSAWSSLSSTSDSDINSASPPPAPESLSLGPLGVGDHPAEYRLLPSSNRESRVLLERPRRHFVSPLPTLNPSRLQLPPLSPSPGRDLPPLPSVPSPSPAPPTRRGGDILSRWRALLSSPGPRGSIHCTGNSSSDRNLSHQQHQHHHGSTSHHGANSNNGSSSNSSNNNNSSSSNNSLLWFQASPRFSSSRKLAET